MIREYTNQLKNYNFLEKIEAGYYLDAKDQGRWKVGQVQQMKKLGHKWIIDVIFDGYSYKFNESYDLPSYSKLAPFRKYTLPYTGSYVSEVKRQQPNKTIQFYIKSTNKISQDIDGLKSQYINQFIRGQLFIFIDFILTRPLNQQFKFTYEECVKVLLSYIDMFDKIFDKMLEFLKQNEKQGNFDQNYIYVYPTMSLLYSLTQFLFNCNSLISKSQQRVTFHRRFGKHQSIQQIYFFFIQKLKSYNIYEKCQKLLQYKTLTGKSLPWSIKKQCLILMKALNKQQPFVIPKQSKQIIELLQYFSYFNKKSIISNEEEERYRVEFIFNLIMGGNFQGKLVGLNQLKKLIASLSYYSSKKDALILDNIKQRKLIQFFLDNNNFNSQLFKRALVVFEYAYKNKLFTKDHFTLIFKLHKDKHELQLMNFYNSLAQIGAFLNYEDALEYYQTMIKQLPFEQNFIELIKNYTIVLINRNNTFKKMYMHKDQDGLGLIYFWNQINNQSKINKPFITKIIEGFATLLNNLYYSKQIQKFVVFSIKAIKQLKNPQSFLKVIHQSLKLCKGPRMNKAIELAQKQINVLEVAINVLRQQSQSLSISGYQNLFQFLEQVNHISRKGLSLNDILFMWKLDKSKCRINLLKFLRKFKIRSNEDKSLQKIINKTLQPAQIQFVIKNIFQSDQLMQQYKQIDQQHYQTIDQLIMCHLNYKKIIDYNYKHTIRYRKNQYFVQDDKMFLGMKFYLKCIQSNSQKYKDTTIKATKRFIEIFLRPLADDWGKNVNDYKVKNWLRVSSAFDKLKNNRLRSIQILLQEINGRMKSLNILEPEPIQLKTQIMGTNKIHTFVVPKYTSLWKFRLIINQYFDLKDTNFQIRLIQNGTQTNLSRQQDLSVMFIKQSRQKNGVSVMIKPSAQQHPHFKAIQRFKQQLSLQMGQNFFNSLSTSTQQNSTMSLNILLKLPFLKSLQKSIQNLDFKQWSDILDISSMKKLQYQLKIIHKIKDMKWLQLFISKQGIKHLAEVVIRNLGKDRYKTLNLVMIFFMQTIKLIMKNLIPFGQQYLKDILYFESQPSQQYIKYLLNCFSLIRQCSKTIRIQTLFQKDRMNKILQYVLFSPRQLNTTSSANSGISIHIIQICKSMNTYSPLNKHLKIFLNLQFLSSKMYNCRAFFEIIQSLIQRNELKQIAQDLQKILLDVRNSDIREKTQNQTNELLYGYLLCLYQFIKAQNNLQQILVQKKSTFVSYLLQQCLFHSNNISLRKFKSKQLRQLGFRFLQMMQFQTKNQQEINNLLIPMMSKGPWRKQFDWNIEPIKIINKKYTGLKNLAATCYINSLLQQLFYIKNFSSQLMNIDSSTIDDKENIVREIQNIFGFLKYTQNSSYTTLPLCQNFILEGQPIDPRIQTDVDQFFHALMDKLERNLAKINKKDIINQVFGGELSNLIIGQQCPHTSQRLQHFLSIRLQIKNKKTIYQALDQFIKGQVLEGQNAYFCQKCDKKVKALKRVCIKDLPQIMIVTLKRFQFDFETMQKFKLNTYCSFPETINVLPYTKEGLQQEVEIKKEDYEYRLKGVIIHYGISEAGHYTSYVRTDDKNWTYFDDQRISEFDSKNMEHQCFGGIQQNPFGDDEDKKKNAYVILYQKVSPQPQSTLKQIPQQTLLQSNVHKLVQEDNTKTRMVNILFQPNIQNYIFNASQLNPKAYLIYYHTVFLRNSKKRQKYVQFYNKCIQLISKKDIAEWYLKQISQSFLMEFVIYGEYEVKYIVTSLICEAMKHRVDLEFIQQCVAMLYVKSIVPFVKIFNFAYFSCAQYGKYLSSINLSQVILNLIKGKDIKQNNVINKVQVRRQITEFGLAASSIIQRKQYDSRELLQSIQGFKTGMTIEEIKQFATSIKSKKTLRSLATITSRKFKQIDQLKKLMDSFLVNQLFTFEPKTGQQTYYGFLLSVIQELCKIKDKQQEQRVVMLMKLYVELIKDALCGFKCELMLITGFFKMALTNTIVRNVLAALLSDKQSKKTVSSIKEWLKDSNNCINQIKDGKWGWWKKPKKIYPGLTAKDLQNQVKPQTKQALSLLNAILQKHITQDMKQTLQVGDNGYLERQKWGPEHVIITRKMGFLVEIKDEQGNHRFISEDEVIKKFV